MIFLFLVNTYLDERLELLLLSLLTSVLLNPFWQSDFPTDRTLLKGRRRQVLPDI
jgi:hypothetical protein